MLPARVCVKWGRGGAARLVEGGGRSCRGRQAKYTPAGAPDFEPSPEMIAEMKATLGDPETNRANFMQQAGRGCTRIWVEMGRDVQGRITEGVDR
eukprot:490446-Pleurochrysis_carterae.AAC.2